MPSFLLPSFLLLSLPVVSLLFFCTVFSGKMMKDVLAETHLPRDVLSRIWGMSDQDKDGFLTAVKHTTHNTTDSTQHTHVHHSAHYCTQHTISRFRKLTSTLYHTHLPP